MTRVVVAMSGGVDSSVAAALALRRGFEVVGVTMTLAPGPAGTGQVARGCCSVWDVTDAEKVAWRLGIPHYVFNLRPQFQESVVQDFLDEYARGRTPNPCYRCNQRIKFEVLLERARRLGAELVVTGHHARLRRHPSGRVRLLRGRDRRKDQSYVLAGLRPDQLRRALFPVGELTKERVRDIARELGLGVADKAESQDLCFIPDGDTASFLGRHLHPLPGPIRDLRGRVLGTHKGLPFYTVGQRRGLGLSGSRRRYVLRLDVEDQAVVVGDEEELLEGEMEVGELNWLVDEPPARARVQYRATAAPGAPAALQLLDSGRRVRVRFDRPQRALTPGQIAVFYRRDEVLGAGTICRTSAAGRAERASSR